MALSPLFITLRGTLLADVITQPDTIAAGSAQDITIEHLGLAGNDTITAWSGPSDWASYATGDLEATETLTIHNYLSGGGGNDVMIAGHTLPGLSETQSANYTRFDTLDGWKGNDTYIVSDLNVTIQDAYGNNTLILTEDFAANSGLTQVTLTTFANGTAHDLQNITLLGTADMDIIGDSQHSIFRGNDGRNLIFSNEGDDRNYGGGGDDTIWGNGNVWESGGEGNDVLRSAAGNSTLLGNAGNDTLMGNEGNDVLNGGGGKDHMVGFTGDDLYQVNLVTDTVDEVFGGGGFDTVSSSNMNLNGANYMEIERLTLLGTANINLAGGNNFVELIGNEGNNYILGGSNSETISGNGGDDTLLGSEGNDVLTGGAGHDAFVFYFGYLVTSVADNDDLITDFTSGEDTIDLSGFAQMVFSTDGFVGAQSIIAFADTVVSHGATRDVIVLSADTNGDQVEDVRMYLDNTSGHAMPVAADFYNIYLA